MYVLATVIPFMAPADTRTEGETEGKDVCNVQE